MKQADYSYAFETGGNRVVLVGDSGYLIFDPDLHAVTWGTAEEVNRITGSVWVGGQLPESFFRYATPQLAEASTREQDPKSILVGGEYSS